jgi:hypothetical protein
MFVITHNNNVILGPMKWNARRFSEVIQDDCEVTIVLPLENDSYYEVNDEIKIWPVQETIRPEYNLSVK